MKKTFSVVLLLIMLLVLCALPCVVHAASADPSVITFEDFLGYLRSSAGIGVVIGFLLTFIVEWWAEWETLDAKMKRVVFFGLCLLIPLAASAVGVVVGYFPAAFDATFWPALVAGFAAFTTGTVAHIRLLPT